MPHSSNVRRVALLFSGGPAPAANAVIAAAATSFRRAGCTLVGIRNGYSALQEYDAVKRPLAEGDDYFVFEDAHLRGLRNSRGILIGTARANPGEHIKRRKDLDDPKKTERLARVHAGLRSLEVDALVSIGGDDTLRSANLFYEFQSRLPQEVPRVRVVHLPKTIDNDYRGIDFTFGFFTAVDVMAKELLNLRADAMATGSYFIAETMGRRAGWLAYGVAMAGEAHMVVGVEDVVGPLATEEAVTDPVSGETRQTVRLSLNALSDRIIELIRVRAESGRHYGTVVLAEGLAEMLSESYLEGLPRDEHGHLSLGKIDLARLVAGRVSDRYERRFGQKKKVIGLQLGYESRCSAPHAFDVMLGSQLGAGACRAIIDEQLDGHMVSVGGQLELRTVAFSELVDTDSLRAEVRFVDRESDFHRLSRLLTTRVPD